MTLSGPARRAAALDIPFDATPNDAAEQARDHTLDWLRGFGLLRGEQAVQEYDALRLERLMAYFYPRASVTELCLASDFNGWFFVFDDQFDGELGRRPGAVARLVGTLTRALDADGQGALLPRSPHASPPASTARLPVSALDAPLVAAFRDIWRRATAGMPPAWCRRFGAHWREYLSAHRCEAAGRVAGGPPSLERYLQIRRRSIGVQPCLDFGERCTGQIVPEPLHRSLPLALLRSLTVDVVVFVNDLVSLDKERAAGDANNSVLVLRAATGCTLEDAVECVSRISNARVTRFRQLATALPRTLDSLGGGAATPETRGHLTAHLDTMRRVMRGNLSWSLETPRYAASGVSAVSDGRRRPWAGRFERTEPIGGHAGPRPEFLQDPPTPARPRRAGPEPRQPSY